MKHFALGPIRGSTPPLSLEGIEPPRRVYLYSCDREPSPPSPPPPLAFMQRGTIPRMQSSPRAPRAGFQCNLQCLARGRGRVYTLGARARLVVCMPGAGHYRNGLLKFSPRAWKSCGDRWWCYCMELDFLPRERCVVLARGERTFSRGFW